MTEKPKTAVKRPISPHLTIYKPQITSIMSITHRFTGVVLFLGAILFCWWIVINIYGCKSCVNALIASDYFGKPILVAWSLALFYHLLNGIRHLFWDIGVGYEIKKVNESGIFVLIGTLLLTFVTWFAGNLF